ncbi:MAG: M23 family metallopeptidase [Ignavibacteria bacterium]|jgi:murein DD-endopeptidase MepM/ murein hydrolase activator NlpD
MNKTLISIVLSFVFINLLSAQSLQLFGEAKPGTVMFGIAEDAQQVMLDEKILQLDGKGIFTLGFDRDAKGKHFLKVKYNNGDVEVKTLQLEKRKYKVQRINNMDQNKVTPPSDQMNRIVRERNEYNAAKKEIGKIDSAMFDNGFTRPVKGGRITGVFGSQRILNGTPKSPHNGLDIANPRGTPVYAMADGNVIFIADTFYYAGSFVLIDHGQGLTSRYLHLSKKDVKPGDYVKKGQKIGEIGSTGRSTGPHLHWSIQWYDKRIDPQSILDVDFSYSEKYSDNL